MKAFLFNNTHSLSLYPCTASRTKQTTVIKEPTIRIQCLSGSMLITIKDAPSSGHDNSIFSGMIYPKGLSKNSSCLTEYRYNLRCAHSNQLIYFFLNCSNFCRNHDGPLKYKLPLRSCNTMPQETVSFVVHIFRYKVYNCNSTYFSVGRSPTIFFFLQIFHVYDAAGYLLTTLCAVCDYKYIYTTQRTHCDYNISTQFPLHVGDVGSRILCVQKKNHIRD